MGNPTAISATTADMVVPLVQGLAASGVLHRDEAKSLVAVIREASQRQSRQASEVVPGARLCKARDAADRLGISTRTLFRMVRQGLIEGVYLTGSRKSLRFRAEDVDALMAGGCTNG